MEDIEEFSPEIDFYAYIDLLKEMGFVEDQSFSYNNLIILRKSWCQIFLYCYGDATIYNNPVYDENYTCRSKGVYYFCFFKNKARRVYINPYRLLDIIENSDTWEKFSACVERVIVENALEDL